MKKLVVLMLAYAVLICPAFAENLARPSQTCSNLTGRYSFYGEWERFDIEGGQPEAVIAYRATNAKPPFDRFALGVSVRQVIEPRVVHLRHDTKNGEVLAEIIGAGSDNSVQKESASAMSARIQIQCVGDRWQRVTTSSGGGENSPSETFERIFLWINSQGSLYAEGESQTSIGWLLKRNLSKRWVAKFLTVPHK